MKKILIIMELLRDSLIVMKKYIFLPLFIFSINGCLSYKIKHASSLGPEDLLIRGNIAVGAERLTKTELKNEISLLVYALRHAYSGRDYIKSSIFENTVQNLERLNKKNINLTSIICREIAGILYAIPDEHLTVSLPNGTSCSYSKKRISRIGDNITLNQALPWKIEKRLVKKSTVVIIGIRSFPAPTSMLWKGFTESLKEILTSADSLIIDLRGNSGGDDRKAYELAHLLFGGEFPLPYDALIRNFSAANYALMANNAMVRLQNNFRNNEELDPTLLHEYLRNLNNIDKAVHNLLPVVEFDRKRELALDMHLDPLNFIFDVKNGFSKPIFILFDRECGSSGEILIDLLEYHPFAKRYGQPSSGTIHFGNAFPLILPYSKIKITIGQVFRKYRDGRFIERQGILPQVYIPDGIEGIDFIINQQD